MAILADYACYHWVHWDAGTNASFEAPDPAEYFDDVRGVLDVVDAHTEPGEFRDNLYGRWYRGKLLGRLGAQRVPRPRRGAPPRRARGGPRADRGAVPRAARRGPGARAAAARDARAPRRLRRPRRARRVRARAALDRARPARARRRDVDDAARRSAGCASAAASRCASGAATDGSCSCSPTRSRATSPRPSSTSPTRSPTPPGPSSLLKPEGEETDWIVPVEAKANVPEAAEGEPVRA